jgi:Tetraacyldisaccharide-1-P 4''-kinase.
LKEIEKDKHILLLTGIASPAKLSQDSSPYNEHIESLAFSDHDNGTARDMELIKTRVMKLPEGKRRIIATGKDSVRLAAHPHDGRDAQTLYIYACPLSNLLTRPTSTV